MGYYTYYTYKKGEPEKAYIGITKFSKETEYLGSGILLKRNIKKYGKEAFVRINLGEFQYRDEAKYWEEFYIKLYKTEVKYGGYNIHSRGGYSLSKSSLHSEESKKKISNSLKGKNNPMYGKTHTKEARKKISIMRKGKAPWNKGKTNIYSEETRKKFSDSAKERYKDKTNHPFYGKHLSEEHKDLLRKVHTGRKMSDETKKKIRETLIRKRKLGLIKTNQYN